jgi:outer membrane murein-binding lipoprotein Lpp
MIRSLALVGLLLSCLLAGCSGETREDLISNTVNAMDEAAKQLDTLAKDVHKALDKAKKDGTNQLDFTDAIKSTEKLAKTGQKMVAIKGQLESIRSTITPEEKEKNAEEKKAAINRSYKSLQDGKAELEKALKEASEVNRAETRKLEDKLREAIGPFESLSRQSS